MEAKKTIFLVVGCIIFILLFWYIIYNYTGWQYFTMKKGENFQILKDDPSLVGNLRFSNCVFKCKGADGTVKTQNVSSVLNGMAYAYEGNKNKDYVFKLDDPGLSPYSFQISGFNDSVNHPDVKIWGFENPNTEAIMTGYYKILS